MFYLQVEETLGSKKIIFELSERTKARSWGFINQAQDERSQFSSEILSWRRRGRAVKGSGIDGWGRREFEAQVGKKGLRGRVSGERER